jgi:hypothetical protein
VLIPSFDGNTVELWQLSNNLAQSYRNAIIGSTRMARRAGK